MSMEDHGQNAMQPPSLALLFVVMTLGLAASITAAWRVTQALTTSPDLLAALGTTSAAASALFSAATFAVVICTLVLQRGELRIQHAHLVAQIRESKEASQSAATTARLGVLSQLAQHYRASLHESNASNLGSNAGDERERQRVSDMYDRVMDELHVIQLKLDSHDRFE